MSFKIGSLMSWISQWAALETAHIELLHKLETKSRKEKRIMQEGTGFSYLYLMKKMQVGQLHSIALFISCPYPIPD